MTNIKLFREADYGGGGTGKLSAEEILTKHMNEIFEGYIDKEVANHSLEVEKIVAAMEEYAKQQVGAKPNKNDCGCPYFDGRCYNGAKCYDWLQSQQPAKAPEVGVSDRDSKIWNHGFSCGLSNYPDSEERKQRFLSEQPAQQAPDSGENPDLIKFLQRETGHGFEICREAVNKYPNNFPNQVEHIRTHGSKF